jgi:hypothetical protein
MAHEGQVNGGHDGVKLDAGHQLAAVARTGLDRSLRLGGAPLRPPPRRRFHQQSLDGSLEGHFWQGSLRQGHIRDFDRREGGSPVHS